MPPRKGVLVDAHEHDQRQNGRRDGSSAVHVSRVGEESVSENDGGREREVRSKVGEYARRTRGGLSTGRDIAQVHCEGDKPHEHRHRNRHDVERPVHCCRNFGPSSRTVWLNLQESFAEDAKLSANFGLCWAAGIANSHGDFIKFGYLENHTVNGGHLNGEMENGLLVDILVVEKRFFYKQLFIQTGNEEHVTAVLEKVVDAVDQPTSEEMIYEGWPGVDIP